MKLSFILFVTSFKFVFAFCFAVLLYDFNLFLNVGELSQLDLVNLRKVVHVVAGTVPDSARYHRKSHAKAYPEVMEAEECQEVGHGVE